VTSRGQPGTTDGSSAARLATRAASVLRANDLGRMMVAAPRLYPHMWGWDACIVAIGLATVSEERALTELDMLLAAQSRTGMLPLRSTTGLPSR